MSEEVETAVIEGFLHGVGMSPWDDMHDYIAVCARDYAMGEPLPRRSTSTPTPDKLALAVEALEFYAAPHRSPNEGPWGANSADFGYRAALALAAIKAAD